MQGHVTYFKRVVGELRIKIKIKYEPI